MEPAILLEEHFMASKLRIALAQLNFLVGDLEGNTQKMIDAAVTARDKHKADVVVFPELCVCGYPPEDLLFRESMLLRVSKARELLLTVKGIVLVLGLPEQGESGLENRAQALFNGEELCDYAKRELPNYSVFDEKRYFAAGPAVQKMVFTYKGVNLGLGVCEDFWQTEVPDELVKQKAHIMLNLNASPFHYAKPDERVSMMKKQCQRTTLPMVYVNQVGGQDELVFDGVSFVMNAEGSLAVAADFFKEGIYCADYCAQKKQFEQGFSAPSLGYEERIYQALVLGVRDYVNKNCFNGVVLGLSGGIDSALVLAIAVDALGKDRVEAVMMPFRYTSQMSLDDAAEEAKNLNVTYRILPIEPAYRSFMTILSDEMKGTKQDTTEENLQARSRGVILMAISNKKGYLVLTTGNKSEMAVGYATLYGDMAGGLDVLKDVPKTLVYRLSAWRNTQASVIPERVLTRAPSAELAPGQEDQDSLPPYEELDEILKLYIEEDRSAEAIVARGFEKERVYSVIRLVDRNEHKRRQAAVGLRITSRAFGRDRRYPITSGWKAGE